MAALTTLTAALLLAVAGLTAGAPVYQGNVTVPNATVTVHQGNATVHQVNASVHQVNASVHQVNATVHQGNSTSEAESASTYDEDVFRDRAKKFLINYEYTWEDVKYLQDQRDQKSFAATNITDVIVSGYVMPNPKDISVIEKYHNPYNATMPAHRRAEIAPVAEPLEKIYDHILSTMSFDDVHTLYCTITNPFVIDVFDYKDTEFNFENVEKIFRATEKMYGFSNGTFEKLHEILEKANTDMPAGSFPSAMTTLHFGAHFQSHLALRYPVLEYLLPPIYPITWAAYDQRFDPRIDNGPIWWE